MNLLIDTRFILGVQIIYNPPYQMTFGIEGGNSANAKSIYNLFIEQSIKLKPKYLCMITPSRWMTKTAQGIPEAWVDAALSSNKFKIIHDFENASECFPGVEIKGGVNYFLWDRDYKGKCKYYFHQSQDNTNRQQNMLIPKALIFIATADISVNMGHFSYCFISSNSAPY